MASNGARTQAPQAGGPTSATIAMAIGAMVGLLAGAVIGPLLFTTGPFDVPGPQDPRAGNAEPASIQEPPTVRAPPTDGGPAPAERDLLDEPVSDDGVHRFHVGAWLGAWPRPGSDHIEKYTDAVGAVPYLVDVYADWRTPVKVLRPTLEHIHEVGAIPIVTWEPHGLTTPQIAAGERQILLQDARKVTAEAYVGEFATGICAIARADGKPVLIRFMHEMNGNWYSWGRSFENDAGERPNTAASYIQAFRKVHDAFDARCGSSVRFIWAVNHFSVGDGVTFTDTYPGDDYVDFAGIDGYNWGGQAAWGWQSFDEIFFDSYSAVAEVSDRPILIAEIGCSSVGGDKAAWIAETFDALLSGAYPRVWGLVWLNHRKYEVESDQILDWRFDSDPEALAAFRDGVARASSP